MSKDFRGAKRLPWRAVINYKHTNTPYVFAHEVTEFPGPSYFHSVCHSRHRREFYNTANYKKRDILFLPITLANLT